MWISRPVRITGSFFSTMRRRTVFGEQFRASANSSTVIRRTASRAGFFVFLCVWVLGTAPRPICLGSRSPKQRCEIQDRWVRAALVRGAVLARSLGRNSLHRAGLNPGLVGMLMVMAGRSRHAADMAARNGPR